MFQLWGQTVFCRTLLLSSCFNSREDEKVKKEAGVGFDSKQNRKIISRKRWEAEGH